MTEEELDEKYDAFLTRLHETNTGIFSSPRYVTIGLGFKYLLIGNSETEIVRAFEAACDRANREQLFAYWETAQTEEDEHDLIVENIYEYIVEDGHEFDEMQVCRSY